MENPEKLAAQGTQDEDKQSKNTTQYVLDTTMHKQTQITLKRHEPFNNQLEVKTKRTSFEYTKWIIRSRKSKDRQCNGQNEKEKTRNNDSQNTSQKIEQHEPHNNPGRTRVLRKG